MRRVLVPILAAALLAASSTQLAFGAKPDMFVEEVAFAETDDEMCGFDVTFAVSGRLHIKTFTNRHGEVVRMMVNVALRGSFSSDWASVRFSDAGVDRIYFNPDGSETIHVIGNLGLLVIPGHGPALGGAGHVIFQLWQIDDDDFEFEVLAIHGLETDSDVEALCAYLAPPA